MARGGRAALPLAMLLLASLGRLGPRQASAWGRAPAQRARRAAVVRAWRLAAQAEELSTVSGGEVRAEILEASPANVERAARELREGKLVAFPTETVYGLGGAITDREALCGIFAAKKRPRSDPLIVHVTSVEAAVALYCTKTLDARAFEVVDALAAAFWPGPLTIISAAATGVAPEITAGTGCVGVRSPRHPLARELIDATGIPIAAPSANRFGHVSPTAAEHVFADLFDSEITILRPEEQHAAEGAPICEVGIESSVVKVHSDGSQVEILRAGIIGYDDLAEAVAGLGVRVTRKAPTHSPEPETEPVAVDSAPADAGFESPGQFLKHYAPDVPAVLLSFPPAAFSTSAALEASLAQTLDLDLREAVILDIGGRLANLKAGAKAYRDIAQSGLLTEAAQGLFEGLRWAEQVDGAGIILLPDLAVTSPAPPAAGGSTEAALEDALRDRLFRAVSGNTVSLGGGDGDGLR
uniref:Threonylcarbamoyl-AMP synthase n=1 Tax=Phaeomonas parva TaxID=124430 RepID=A0A7S1XM66_9STRA|mmetsp:Transcript_21065/g.64167  ORF Transcript_21065/g.64167 Transcript_21065/m.64167 type:complete len:469 (+) Transcript_21065:101-1507(+)|eukprot:CAMPEP_0118870460 /NCGR_PEP_ID=MMETSP1163-20130328/13412_1 /TAXON_ID=124430 /ORGANISM="Phaeomonas parva, Strain CCMP2877" /LENGTH=468 /DNA_ID=CAMNT_0006805467 /DNA_START=80 /DNA_END=1486 /DNA_ORIENTATION=+